MRSRPPGAVTRPIVVPRTSLQCRQCQQAFAVHARGRVDFGDAGATQRRGGAGADREPLLTARARAARASACAARTAAGLVNTTLRRRQRCRAEHARVARHRRATAAATATAPSRARRARAAARRNARMRADGTQRDHVPSRQRRRRHRARHRAQLRRCKQPSQAPADRIPASLPTPITHRTADDALRHLDAHYQSMPPVAAMHMRIAGYDGAAPAPARAAGAARQRQGLRVRRQPGLADDAGLLGPGVAAPGGGRPGCRRVRRRQRGALPARRCSPTWRSMPQLAADAAWDVFVATLRERGRARATLAARCALPDGGVARNAAHVTSPSPSVRMQAADRPGPARRGTTPMPKMRCGTYLRGAGDAHVEDGPGDAADHAADRMRQPRAADDRSGTSAVRLFRGDPLGRFRRRLADGRSGIPQASIR